MPATPLPPSGDAPAAKTCDASGMIEIHRMFRRSFGEGPALVRGVRAGDIAHAEAVATQLATISLGLHAHHEGEDERLWDALEERAPSCAIHVERMKEQHAVMLVHLAELDAALPAWRASASPHGCRTGARRARRHQRRAGRAPARRGANIVPVMETTITQKEVDWYSEHGRTAPSRRGRRGTSSARSSRRSPTAATSGCTSTCPARSGCSGGGSASRSTRSTGPRSKAADPAPLTRGRARRRTPRAAPGRAARASSRMRLMCVFTVASERNSRAAISALRQPAGREREDLPLALGERRRRRRDRPRRGIREVREQLAGGGCRDHGRSGVHRADRGEQELGVGVLQQEPARSLADRAGGRLVEVERREHHDPRRIGSASRQQLGRGREAVHHRHPDVHQHDVGAAARTTASAFAAVGGLADDLEVGLRVDQHADAGAEQRLIVDEHDADRRAFTRTRAPDRQRRPPRTNAPPSAPALSHAAGEAARARASR